MAHGPKNVAYEPPLLYHMNCFYSGVGVVFYLLNGDPTDKQQGLRLEDPVAKSFIP